MALPEVAVSRDRNDSLEVTRTNEESILNRRLFGDKVVGATDLSRYTSKILDQAAVQPVTITRKDESFALLDRTTASQIEKRNIEAVLFAEFVDAVTRYRAGTLPKDHPYSWVCAFDQEDQDEILREVSLALRRQGRYSEGSGYDVEAVIHECQESALAILDEGVAKAWADRGKEEPVPLTPPADVLSNQGEIDP